MGEETNTTHQFTNTMEMATKSMATTTMAVPNIITLIRQELIHDRISTELGADRDINVFNKNHEEGLSTPRHQIFNFFSIKNT